MAGNESTLSILVKARDLASGTLAKVNKNLGNLGKNAKRGIGNAAGNLAKIGKIAAAAGAGVLAGSVKMAMGFEDQMTSSLAIMGNVSDAMRKKLEGAARQVAKTSTFSAEQAAEAYFFLASAGLDANQQLLAMPLVAKYAQAGNIDLALATDQLTDSQTALGLGSKDAAENLKNMTRIADVFAQANNIANLSIEQLGEAMVNKAGAAMRKFGIEVEDGVAVLNVFASAGLKGQKAGNTLSAMLEGIAIAAVKNKKAFKEYGIEVFDANGNMVDMVTLTENLTKGFEGMSDAERTAAFQQLGINRLTGTGVTLLLGQTKAMSGFRKELLKAGGVVDEVAEKQLQSFSKQLGLLRNNLVDVGIVIGQALLPGLTRLARETTGFLQDNASGIQDFADKLGRSFDRLVDVGLRFVKGIDWASVGTSLGDIGKSFGGAAAEFGPALLGAFRSIPWSTVGDAMKLMGTGTAAALRLFNTAPDWLKTAVITGWGLNKLTGGALGSITMDLGKGVFDQFLARGANPANPLFVADVADVAGGLGGGKGGKPPLLPLAVGVLLPAALVNQGGETERAGNPSLAPAPGEQTDQRIFDLERRIDRLRAQSPSAPAFPGNKVGDTTTVAQEIRNLQAKLDALKSGNATAIANAFGGVGAKLDHSGYIAAQAGQNIVASNVRVGDKIAESKNATSSEFATLRTRMGATETQTVRVGDKIAEAKAAAATDAAIVASAQARAAGELKQAEMDGAVRTVAAIRPVESAARAAEMAARVAGQVNASATRSQTGALVGAIWASGRANRSVTNPQTIIRTTTVQERTGSSSGSRAAGRE
jgi:TP901 family phage tail tape measure protein